MDEPALSFEGVKLSPQKNLCGYSTRRCGTAPTKL
jgi:hypothetical protein